MDYEWVALGLDEVAWLTIAFLFGLGARSVGLPPLVGYLGAGFLLGAVALPSAETTLLDKLADLGITLLLFTVGLKLNLATLLRPQVWAVSVLHMGATLLACIGLLRLLVLLGLPYLAGESATTLWLLAFALSFSSTVFVVKVLEERGTVTSLYGRLAVGVLLIQDIAAVVFLALASGKVPTVWALALLALIPARRLFQWLLDRLGHGELQILYGFLLALGGAELFELVGVKGDIGALILGLCLAGHARAEELAKVMLSFKDLFLLSFFLSIGLAGAPTLDAAGLAALLVPVALLKAALFVALFLFFGLRVRTAFQGGMALGNYSEFGLIVAAIGVAKGWLTSDWLVVLALALSFSFLLSALLSRYGERLYARARRWLLPLQKRSLVDEDRHLTLAGAKVAVVGMGGVGTGAYDALAKEGKRGLIGIDIDPLTAEVHEAAGRQVLRGDPSDPDFWERLIDAHTLELVLIALPTLSTTLSIIERLRLDAFEGQLAATCRFEDEAEALRAAGADIVFNMYADAGPAFVARVEGHLDA